MFERGGHADLNSSSAVVMLGLSSDSLVQIELCVVRSVPPHWSCQDASSDFESSHQKGIHLPLSP